MQGNNVYKGFRYIPKNEGDWIKDNSYEALTVVQYQGNSYTSKICVPRGVDILDTRFWIQTANYNQQFENLRDTFNTTTAETIKELNDFKSKQDNEFADLLQSHKDNVNDYVEEMSKELEDERNKIQQGGLNDVITQLNDISNKTMQRIFKPKFGCNPFWGDCLADGTPYNPTNDAILSELNKFNELKTDGIMASFHIGYNPSTGLYMSENLTTLMPLVYNNLQLPILGIKLHITRIDQATINSLGDTFKTQYKNIVGQVLDYFQNKGIENFYVLNEMDWLYADSTYTAFIQELFTMVRNKGFKVGVTFAGLYNLKNKSSIVMPLLDILGINHYPAISFTGGEVTKEESVQAWNYDNIIGYIKDVRNTFNNIQKIEVTESGVQDYWIALSRPSYYSWDSGVKIPTNGKAPNTYMIGMLETLNNKSLDSVYWLFDIYYPNETNKTINWYLRGEK